MDSLFYVLLYLPIIILPVFCVKRYLKIENAAVALLFFIIFAFLSILTNILSAFALSLIVAIMIMIFKKSILNSLFKECIVISFDQDNHVLTVSNGTGIFNFEAETDDVYTAGDIIKLKSNCLYNFI